MLRPQLQLPPDTEFVGLARLVVVSAARRAGMTQDRLEDLRIAVSEAIANAVLAHQREGSREPVVLSFGADGGTDFEVVVADAGPGFEPSAAGLPSDRDWTVEGGLGVTLIRGLADEVEFVRGHGMQVYLRFAVALSGSGD